MAAQTQAFCSIRFVDDDAEYVGAAEAIGMHGVVICRHGAAPAGTMATLAQLRARIWPTSVS